MGANWKAIGDSRYLKREMPKVQDLGVEASHECCIIRFDFSFFYFWVPQHFLAIRDGDWIGKQEGKKKKAANER